MNMTILRQHSYPPQFLDIINSIKGLSKLDWKDVDSICEMLACSDAADSYVKSACYMLFTGRRGLWLYRANKWQSFVCLHPNINDRLLIFPPVGELDFAEYAAFVKKLRKSGAKLDFCRFENLDIIAPLGAVGVKLVPVIEQKLDWMYPCVILSTERVVALIGAGFENVRGRLRQIDQKSVVVRDIDIKRDKEEITNFVGRWAKNKDAQYIENYLSPYICLLDLMESGLVTLYGRLIYYNNKLSGFSIYERPASDLNIANAFSFIGDHDTKGMSEYVVWDMCQKLLSDKVSKVNLGGSENFGLNRFKNKFDPIKLVKIYTLNEVKNPANDL